MGVPYLITFTPVQRFFFGGSYSLGEGFYAESMKFPTQLSILGCIRSTVLLQKWVVLSSNPLFPDIESSEAKNLTGRSKLDSIFDTNGDFGQIERVSPVFLVKNNKDTDSIEDFLFNIPFDVEKKNDELYVYDVKKIENAKSNFSEKVKKDYGVITGRDNKKELPSYYGGKAFFEAYMGGSRQLPYFKDYESSEIFVEHRNVGIGKNIDGAFYVKIDYSLKEGFSFGVIIWLKENGDFIKDGFVQLGGEQSVFLMKVNKLDGDLLEKVKCNPVISNILSGNLSFNTGLNKIVAISPLILNPADFQTFLDSVDYMIINELKAIRYARRTDDEGQPTTTKKSQAIRMLPSGSVIYLNESFDFSKNSNTPFKIGYNNILIIK